jgi:tripartite-type tricarboxylate transporter receptor subunit TctC
MSHTSCIARAFLATMTVALITTATPAFAQEYPNKPIRYVVPNSPGTLIDLTARIISTEMSKTLGQPMLIDNRPSADSIIGYEAVAKAAPDGYTLASVLVGELVILPVIRKDLRFDPVKDLPPVIAIADGRFLLGSAASVPWKTFGEMVSTVKANPGKYNFGTSSIVGRLYTEAIIRDLGLNLVHIPYKSGGDYLRGMSTGEFHIGFVGESALINFGDKVRSVAVTGLTRLPTFPTTPTFQELGQLRTRNNTFAMHSPAGMPKAITDKLAAAAAAALQQPEVRAQFAKIRLEVVGLGPEASAKSMADTARLFADIAKSVGIQPE